MFDELQCANQICDETRHVVDRIRDRKINTVKPIPMATKYDRSTENLT